MKQIFIISLLSAMGVLPIFAQNYWQQQVDYKIETTLDDQKHELNSFLTLTYTNNSPDKLGFIYFHLWPNAYLNDQTAYARQEVENGSTEFYYAKQSERGYIDQLDFKANNATLKTEPYPKNPDIIKVVLPSPLEPQKSITISTPFHVKIPETFSRLGHVGQSYQITQWYPKPAVYDHKGWHEMPYLDQGEFYSEYGSFEVTINLPKNYVVGATGDLQNEDEKQFLLQKAKETATISEFQTDTAFPESSNERKTLTYRQKNVHDFAWFADKRFHVLYEQANLESGRQIDCWAMFTNDEADIWKQGAFYVKRSVEFYSKLVGEYPYQQATALQSALSAGGGMEYPNVTVIGLSRKAKQLDIVITHEVGHNWFYGQLGSNEREHPWLDEGINSYYEQRYIDIYYPPNPNDKVKVNGIDLSKFVDLDSGGGRYLAYQYAARKHEDQAIEGHSAAYTDMNYGIIVYMKTALVFKYLEKYLGTDNFDKIMHQYYRQYEFKHPYPEDIRAVFEKESGKNLTWFFEQLLKTNATIDYSLKKVATKVETIGKTTYDKVTVKQGRLQRDSHGNPIGAYGDFTYIKAPFPISAVKDGKVIHTIWYDGFNGEAEVLFPSMEYDKLVIDAANNMPDLDRSNNQWHKNGICHRSLPTRLQFLGGLERSDRRQIFYLPALGYNHYDKAMLGMAFYSPIAPQRTIEYALAPMVSLKNFNFSGIGNIDFNIYPKNDKKWWHKLKISLEGMTFGSGDYRIISADSLHQTIESTPAKYYRLSDQFTLTLRPKSLRSSIRTDLFYRDVLVFHRQFKDCPDGYNCTEEGLRENNYIGELGIKINNSRVINPLSYQLSIQSDFDRFHVAQTQFKYRFSFPKKNKGFDIRLYAAAFIKNDTLNPQRLTVTDAGRYDYMYDNLYFGRFESDGFWKRQIAERNAAFKLPNPFTSNRALLALNLKTNLPLPFIKLYADAGYILNRQQFDGDGTRQLLFDTGIYLSIIPNTFEIYFPLFHAKAFNNYFETNNIKWYEKISFKINLKRLNPLQQVRNFSL